MGAFRVLCENLPPPDTIYNVPSGQTHHLLHVRRCRVGEKIALIDRHGRTCGATVTEIAASSVLVDVENYTDAPVKVARKRCHLYCALIPEKRFDFVLQKGTEIGITTCTPVETARTVVVPRKDKSLRWQRICDDAARQCGGPPMQVCPTRALDDVLAQENGVKVLADAQGMPHSAYSAAEAAQEIHLLIGPEGGFSEEEYAAACVAGWTPVAFHTNILRVETAVIVAATCLMI